MLRPWHVWLAFLACLTSVAIALGWLSYHAAQLDKAEAAARRLMAIEENARLALWRMDSAMATFVSQESARPYYAYQSFNGTLANSPPKSVESGLKVSGSIVPSPLLTETNPLVRLHFEIDVRGNWNSPRTPSGIAEEIAVPTFLSSEALRQSQSQLEALKERVDAPKLLASLPEAIATGVPESSSGTVHNGIAQSTLSEQQQANAAPQQQIAQQRSSNEYLARLQLFSDNLKTLNRLPAFTTPTDVRAAVMTPVWAGSELLLARKVIIDGVPVVQACWLDLPAIYKQLLDSTRDLLPSAGLRPAKQPVVEQAHLMASLPLELIPGEVPLYTSVSFSPMQLALITAWTAFGLAAIAVALLLFGVISLSERRASFVSAVTHELRTPLTTFRLYSEMLSEGMVAGEEARQKYLYTLRAEADRLMHLVENVLAYARLERGRIDKRIVPISIEELIQRVEPRLTARSEQAGLDLTVDIEKEMLETKVQADSAAVEQILFNLVDNACKYAATAEDRTLALSVEQQKGRAAIRLRDHGPGISSGERSKLFRPFHKSAHEAAVSAPGVGLGLALSRRLAHALGGDLRLEQSSDGTQFSLILNLASKPV